MILCSLWGTKIRIVTVNRELAINYVIDGATDVLTQNEGVAYLEARVDVAVRLGGITYSSIRSAIYFF